MSAGAIVEAVAGIVGGVLEIAEGASEREREQIREVLADAEAGLRSLAPNGPRIRALVEERRRARAGETRSAGRIAFEAYSAKRGGKNHDGTPTPTWDALGEGVRDGWEAAATAARSS